MFPAIMWSFVETRHALSTNIYPDNPGEINGINNYRGCKGGLYNPVKIWHNDVSHNVVL